MSDAEAKKKDILDKGAIVQRDRRTYAITPRIPCGLITDFNILRKIADVAEKYGAQAIKVTSAQRIAIIGIEEDKIDAVWADLGMEPGMASGLCMRGVKACPGNQFCVLGTQDSLGLGLKLEARFAHIPLPNKMKMAVSGCPLDCAESHVRDIGVVGTKKGYTLELGGSAGASPRLADTVATKLTAEEVEAAIDRVVQAYKGLGKKKRLGAAIEAVGLEEFKALAGL